MQTDLPQSLLWCTVYCSEAAGAEGRQTAAAHLEAFLAGRLDTSQLAEQRRHQASGQLDAGAAAGEAWDEGQDADEEQGSEEQWSEEEEEEEGKLDEYLLPPSMWRHWRPLLTFVTVPELPRGWAGRERRAGDAAAGKGE